jgi:hypothetical protein
MVQGPMKSAILKQRHRTDNRTPIHFWPTDVLHRGPIPFHRRTYVRNQNFDKFQDRRPPPTPSTKSVFKNMHFHMWIENRFCTGSGRRTPVLKNSYGFVGDVCNTFKKCFYPCCLRKLYQVGCESTMSVLLRVVTSSSMMYTPMLSVEIDKVTVCDLMTFRYWHTLWHTPELRPHHPETWHRTNDFLCQLLLKYTDMPPKCFVEKHFTHFTWWNPLLPPRCDTWPFLLH